MTRIRIEYERTANGRTANERTETIVPAPQVDRLDREIDFRAARDRQHEARSAFTKRATYWTSAPSTRKMAKRSGVSRSAVSRLWRAFKLRPHRQDTFTLSTDDFFVEKVRDIVGLDMSPPDHAVVLCVDEKSAIQALERSQPLLPIDFGQSVQRTHTYTRHGTTNPFAALDRATGKVIGECYPR